MPESISYTPDEVAKILKISRFTVYEMIKRGDLPSYRIGRKVRVEEPDLDQYIKKSKGVHSQEEPQGIEMKAAQHSAVDEGMIICGQDVLLDVLTRYLETQMPNSRFLRNYNGSISGLLSLYRREVNVVTAHLWDSDSDEYNVPYVRRLVPGYRTLIINLTFRMEGFYVAKGNPKQIHDWEDLTRPDVRFVNREPGAGSRVLLDEKLRVMKIDHRDIHGYQDELTTHLAVASCVARGDADVGVGVEKAALQVSGVEFIPLQKERYDLVIRKDDFDKPQFRALMRVLNSTNFKNDICGVGGYDISRTGQIIAEV